MRFRDLTMAVLDGAVKTQLREMAHEIRCAPSAAYERSTSNVQLSRGDAGRAPQRQAPTSRSTPKRTGRTGDSARRADATRGLATEMYQ